MAASICKKSISIIMLLCLMVMVLFSSVAISYAETDSDAADSNVDTDANLSDGSIVNDENSVTADSDADTEVQEQQPKQHKVIHPRKITKAEISKIKKYKGKNAKKIPVITYHRILSDSVKNSPEYVDDIYSISLSEFKKQMAWLRKKHYRTITCGELYLWHEGKIKLPKRSVLITLDDGHGASVEKFASVLSKNRFKGTVFIIGKSSCIPDERKAITVKRIRQLSKNNKYIEFQSHSYGIHRPDAKLTETYDTVMDDAALQRELFGFEYLAYPHGRYSAEMIRAYQDSGIRMAFTFGAAKNGYATKKQDLYKIKRIRITGQMPLKEFRKWCK